MKPVGESFGCPFWLEVKSETRCKWRRGLVSSATGGFVAQRVRSTAHFACLECWAWPPVDASGTRVTRGSAAAMHIKQVATRTFDFLPRKVILRGFKTYKDQARVYLRARERLHEVSLLEDFHSGVNVIVGRSPEAEKTCSVSGFNGSGKSNLFNAILFVISDHFGSLRQVH